MRRRRHPPPPPSVRECIVVAINDENRRPRNDNRERVDMPDGDASKTSASSSRAGGGPRPHAVRAMLPPSESHRGDANVAPAPTGATRSGTGGERRCGPSVGGTDDDDEYVVWSRARERERYATRECDDIDMPPPRRPTPPRHPPTLGEVADVVPSDAYSIASILRPDAPAARSTSTTAAADVEEDERAIRRNMLMLGRRSASMPNANDDASSRITKSFDASTEMTSTNCDTITSTTTTNTTAADPTASSLGQLPCLIRLVLVSYEVARRRPISTPSLSSFYIISDLSGHGDILHISFALSIFVGGLSTAYSAARRRHDTMRSSSSTLSCMFHVALTFLVVVSCWMAVLPIYGKCIPSETWTIGNYCPLVMRYADRLRGGGGRGAMRSATIDASYGPLYSALDVLVSMWLGRASRFAKSKIKGRVWREVQRGLFRPFSFHGRIMRLLRLLRWAKFVGPLFGTCNKFRGHFLDMIEKRRQHVRSRAAWARWNVVLDALSRKTREEWAVLKLQRRFREGRESKSTRRLALMSSTTGDVSNIRVEIRRRLVEEQLRSRVNLRRIEMNERGRIALRQISKDDRGNIARHRRSTRTLRKRLLLSPKTYFAVSWKYLTIICAAIEISQFVFAPALSGELKKMDLDAFLLRAMGASRRPAHRCDRNGSPTMCHEWWPTIARTFAAVLAPTVNAIVFLDVFVTFFTGELTSSGTLVPKAPVSRWIFPGIGLQLIVNPTMVMISTWVKHAIATAMLVGPSLSFHLLLSCMPLFSYCRDRSLDAIFDFVERQNRILSK